MLSVNKNVLQKDNFGIKHCMKTERAFEFDKNRLH